MTAIQLIQFAYKLLRIVLLVLILGGVGFLLKFFLEKRAAQIEYRPYLERLEDAYQLRKRNIVEELDRKIRSAPTEVMALAYQQEKSALLTEAEEMYFSDKRAIFKREYGVLERNWGAELSSIPQGAAARE